MASLFPGPACQEFWPYMAQNMHLCTNINKSYLYMALVTTVYYWRAYIEQIDIYDGCLNQDSLASNTFGNFTGFIWELTDRSESPSQVFMIVLSVMMLELSNKPDEKLDGALEKFVLSYDDMCQLDSLKAARDPLPFPAPYKMMRKGITKIIDRLHMQNHKNPKCKELCNQNKIPKEHNTMIEEQTFAWFSRFKKFKI